MKLDAELSGQTALVKRPHVDQPDWTVSFSKQASQKAK